jgi:hypothetical protein
VPATEDVWVTDAWHENVPAAVVVDHAGDDDDDDDDGGAIVVAVAVAVVLVVPVIVVDDACSLKDCSWNDTQQVFLFVVVAVAVDHVRVRMDVVERLHKRFVLTFVDDDVVVHEPLHHCCCHSHHRKSLVLSSV